MALIKQVNLRIILVALLIMMEIPLKIQALGVLHRTNKIATNAKIRETSSDGPEIKWEGPVWIISPTSGHYYIGDVS